MPISLARIVLSSVLGIWLVQAQSPKYPACLPSEEAALALETVQRVRDPRADGAEIATEEIGILRAALTRRPDDFHIQRRFLWTIGGRSFGTLHQEQIAGYKQQLSGKPNDPALRFLQAQSLIGSSSPEALRLFERLAEDFPDFAWPRLALAELHSFPAFQDHAKMQAHSLAFLQLCPDSLDAYDLLYRTSGAGLAEPTAKLRSLLSSRTDPAAARAWGRLWNLEFKVRPASEHDALRQQISKDIAVLRPAMENEYLLLNALLQGARLTGDAPLVKALQSRQNTLLPVKYRVREQYSEWPQKNPYPKAGAPLSEVQKYRRAKLAMLDELLGEDPLNVWFLRERLSLLADEGASAQVLGVAGERVLKAAVPREETWVTTPPTLMVASVWARRGVNRPQLDALVERGLAHQARIERNDQASDLLDAKLIASERKERSLSNRINAFDIAAEVYIRLGEFNKARRALFVVADVVKAYRDDLAAYGATPPDATDRYRMSLESLSRHWEHRLFLGNAGLAKAETRKLDALTYYASALRTANRLNTANAANSFLADASVLWKELGGTLEGWQQWLDHAALPAPADSLKTEISKATAWIKADRPFPAFRLLDLEGRRRTLEDLKGAVTVVNVWATWCEPCRRELPALQKLHDRLRESGAARVITLNTDISTGLVGPFVGEHKYGFPVWLGQPVFDELKPMGGIPVNWIIDPQGVIRWESVGFSGGKDEEWISGMLAKIQEVR